MCVTSSLYKCQLESLLLCFPSDFLQMPLTRQGMVAQVLGTLLPTWVRDTDGIPGTWLQPGPELAGVGQTEVT